MPMFRQQWKNAKTKFTQKVSMLRVWDPDKNVPTLEKKLIGENIWMEWSHKPISDCPFPWSAQHSIPTMVRRWGFDWGKDLGPQLDKYEKSLKSQSSHTQSGSVKATLKEYIQFAKNLQTEAEKKYFQITMKRRAQPRSKRILERY